MSFTKFISIGSINQSTDTGATTGPIILSGFEEKFAIYEDDANNRVHTPSNPKALRALAKYDSILGDYNEIEEIGENWNDPSKNYRIRLIESSPDGEITGVNLSEIPKEKIFRRIGSSWCKPVCETDYSQENAGQVTCKFWNSRAINVPFIKYKVKYKWSVMWEAPGYQAPGYPPLGYDTYGLGPPIEQNGEVEVTFDGKSQANADVRVITFTPKPPDYIYVSPADGQSYPQPWRGGSSVGEVLSSVEFLPPIPEFWIKQHA